MRGTVNCRAHIDRDVQLTDRDGNVFVATQVITISTAHAPVADDLILIDGHTYVLVTLIDDNGYSAKFVGRKA